MEKSSGAVSSYRKGFLLFGVYLKHLGLLSTTSAVALLACALKGDVALISLLAYKTYTSNFRDQSQTSVVQNNTSDRQSGAYDATLPDYLQVQDDHGMKDLLLFIVIAILSSQVMYHTICGFLKLYFYKLQRGNATEWKCQPHRFMTRENEIHEFVVGTINMTLTSSISGILACWVANGNYSSVYFRVGEYGYLYFALSIPLLFLWMEGSAFYLHMLMHTPWLYKTIHKHHHRYSSPTPYSAIAMSPFEALFFQSLMVLPIFTVPIHAMVFIGVVVYVYYYGIMEHSGIKMESWFPWQPDTMFHDDHHRYFHVNFGFNIYLFDWLHGTLRNLDREYGEHIFGGKGRKKED